MIRQFMAASLSVVLAVSLVGCGGAELDSRDPAMPEKQIEASAELLQYGVHSYQVAEQENATRVSFVSASQQVLGELTLLGNSRDGYTHMDLSWSGKAYAFELDRASRMLTVSTDGQSAKLAAGTQVNQFTGDAAAMELYGRIEPQWKLISSTLEALSNASTVQTFTSSSAVTAQSRDVVSTEYTCTYCATWESCSFFWHRYYSGTYIGNGQCWGGSSCGC
jgi:hypothetical protein